MPDTLLVPVEKVAPWLGLEPATLNDIQTELITDAILDAQSKVTEFLCRPLEPRSETLRGLYRDEAYPHTDVRAWPEAETVLDDRLKVASYAVNADNAQRFDVTFDVGLDVETDPELDAIRRFIRQDAVAGLQGAAALVVLGIAREVTSVSAEGQSVSYAKKPSSPDAAGGQMTVGSLRRWKRYAVGRAATLHDTRPFPYRG